MNKYETIPEEKQKQYYWLCENASPKIANLWLDGRKDEFQKEMKELVEIK